jgi:pyruvate kinase
MQDQGSKHVVFVDYPTLASELEIGQKIFIDDGLLALSVKETDPEAGTITCKVLNDSKLGQQKGVNIPYPFISNLPSVTPQDLLDLKFAAENNVDMIFASFVRKAEDVEAVRDALRAGMPDPAHMPLVISKIENQEGCDNFDEILEASDGIMVARGDLGIEIPPQKVKQALLASHVELFIENLHFVENLPFAPSELEIGLLSPKNDDCQM